MSYFSKKRVRAYKPVTLVERPRGSKTLEMDLLVLASVQEDLWNKNIFYNSYTIDITAIKNENMRAFNQKKINYIEMLSLVTSFGPKENKSTVRQLQFLYCKPILTLRN